MASLEVVKKLDQHDHDLCFPCGDSDGRLPLHAAIIKGGVKVVSELINACPESVIELTAKQETALHLAVKWNQPNVIRFLVEILCQLNLKEFINWQDDKGNTVLHLAVCRKQLETVQLLLARNKTGVTVQLNSKNKSGLTPLDLLEKSASELGDREIGEILRSAGALKGCNIGRLTTPPPWTQPQTNESIRANCGCMASASDEDRQSIERLMIDAVRTVLLPKEQTESFGEIIPIPSENLLDSVNEVMARNPKLATQLYHDPLSRYFARINGGSRSIWNGNELVREENLLYVGSEQVNLESVNAILTQNPEFATQLNQEGFSLMHLASMNGHVEVVRKFWQHNRSFCFLRDRDGRLPLHGAITKGRVQVVRELTDACPESARELTIKLETALHLAVKCNQLNVIRFLLKRFRQLNLEELINWEDNEGNTVLHLAVDRKQLETVELLLARNIIGVTVHVNSKNKSGLTPLDLLGESPSELGDREIGEILRSAGALKGCDIGRLRMTPPHIQTQPKESIRAKCGCMLPKITLETRNVTLVVFVFIATLMFAILSNPPSLLLGGHTQNSIYSIQEVIFGPSRPPSFFYMTLFSTMVFLMAMGVILVLMWPLPFRGILLFCFICFSISYGIILHKTMPEFTVICVSIHIPSFWFACLGFLALGFIGCMLNLILVSFCYICTKFNGPCADDPNILQLV